jgi:hypothetical protein
VMHGVDRAVRERRGIERRGVDGFVVVSEADPVLGDHRGSPVQADACS